MDAILSWPLNRVAERGIPEKGFLIRHAFISRPYSGSIQQAQGPKTPRPIRIEQCFPTGVVRTWYALGTECVWSDEYGASTELVRSGYGAARSIFFFRSPYTPQNTF